MTDLMRYASQLAGAPARAPVHLWDPPFCGNIDLVIRSDGTWMHEGTPITRARLVRLFSTVLKKQGDDFFLVTPVEKLGITVEDAPFLAVQYTAEMVAGEQVLGFTTNVGENIIADSDHPLQFRPRPGGTDSAPYIMVRDGLEARLARPVYYDLVAMAQVARVNGEDQFGVRSAGIFFSFGRADDVFGDVRS